MNREHVIVEVETEGRWITAGSVCDVEPPASLSSELPTGREVYLVGWIDDDGPGVWISNGGVDRANDAVRVVHTTGLRKIVNLLEGPSSLELTRQGGSPIQVRFVYHQ